MRTIAHIACCLAIAIAGQATPSQAQKQPGDKQQASEIIKALQPRRTRSLKKTANPNAAVVEQLVSIRKTRALSFKERDDLYVASRELAQVDLTIFFDLNSAEITAEAYPVLEKLGVALSSDELRRGRFLVGGHTDARGTAEHNQALSERRAEAIRGYLIKRFGIAADRLVPVGYGAEQLKNSADPRADENRRVQLVNFSG